MPSPKSKITFLRDVMRVLAKDEEPVDFDNVDSAMAALRSLVANMDPAEQAHFIELLSDSDIGELLLGGQTATDEPPPFPGMPKTGGTLDPLARYGDPRDEPRLRAAADRLRRAQDTAFDARMASAATRRAPTLALDNQSVSLAALVPEIARIGRI